MSISVISGLLETLAVKFDSVDAALCARFNRSSQQDSLRVVFRTVSRLGDGVVWYAVLVALSRMILGLHYPTDVLAGALLGAGLALLSFDVVTLPGY